MCARSLVTGATGYVGGRLVEQLHRDGVSVGAVVREPDRASLPEGVSIHHADVLDPESLSAIGDGYDSAYYLVHSMGLSAARGREIEIGAPEVLTYGRMLERMSDALGRRRALRIPVPLLTPWLSSHWIGLVTPVDAGVARPLVEGLSTDTTVQDPSGMALYDIVPMDFDAALTEAISEAGDAPG